MSTAIGGTCVGWFDSDTATYTDENRKLESTRHEPIYSNTLHKNYSLKRKLIINFDSYNNGRPRGWTSEANLRNLIETSISELYNVGALYGLSQRNVRQLTTFTFDNEADEIYNVASYCNWARIFIDQVNDRFDIGLGNFNGLQLDWYNYVCANVSGFKYLDIHLQKDFESISKVDANMPKLKNVANRYGKVLRVTEAFPVTVDLWTQAGYNLLLHQLNKSIEYGCPEFCCFIRFDRPGDYRKLVFLRGTGVHPNWNEFKNIIEANKPDIILEEEDLILEKYYSRGRTYRRDVKRAGVRFIQTVVGQTPDSLWGPLTDDAVKAYQQEHGLLVDAIVGPQTFRDMMKNFPNAYIDLNYFTGIGEW